MFIESTPYIKGAVGDAINYAYEKSVNEGILTMTPANLTAGFSAPDALFENLRPVIHQSEFHKFPVGEKTGIFPVIDIVPLAPPMFFLSDDKSEAIGKKDGCDFCFHISIFFVSLH